MKSKKSTVILKSGKTKSAVAKVAAVLLAPFKQQIKDAKLRLQSAKRVVREAKAAIKQAKQALKSAKKAGKPARPIKAAKPVSKPAAVASSARRSVKKSSSADDKRASARKRPVIKSTVAAKPPRRSKAKPKASTARPQLEVSDHNGPQVSAVKLPE